MIGPNVIQAIINHTGNNWKGFPFLFAVCAVASLAIWFFVDVKRGRRDAVMFAEKRRSQKREVKNPGSGEVAYGRRES